MNKKGITTFYFITSILIVFLSSCNNNKSQSNDNKIKIKETIKVDDIESYENLKQKDILNYTENQDSVKLLLDFYVDMSKKEYYDHSLKLVDDGVLIKTRYVNGDVYREDYRDIYRDINGKFYFEIELRPSNNHRIPRAKLIPNFQNDKLKEIKLLSISFADFYKVLEKLKQNYGRPIVDFNNYKEEYNGDNNNMIDVYLSKNYWINNGLFLEFSQEKSVSVSNNGYNDQETIFYKKSIHYIDHLFYKEQIINRMKKDSLEKNKQNKLYLLEQQKQNRIDSIITNGL